jgi:hypothetical protein
MSILFHLKTKREAMHVERNNETRSCNHFCGGKAVSITQLVCVFVAFDIQLAMRMLHIVTCSLPRSTIFSHILINAPIFGNKSY